LRRRRLSAASRTLSRISRPLYENPDAFAKDLVRPEFKIEKVVKDTVTIFENIPLRGTPDDPGELPEGLTVIVVDYDGVNRAKLVTEGLAPSDCNFAKSQELGFPRPHTVPFAVPTQTLTGLQNKGTLFDVARASRPQWRGHPARAFAGRDAPAAAGETPALPTSASP
jgi:hypothetical protein